MLSRVAPTQVRCGATCEPAWVRAVTISVVRAWVLPPAPKVTLK